MRDKLSTWPSNCEKGQNNYSQDTALRQGHTFNSFAQPQLIHVTFGTIDVQCTLCICESANGPHVFMEIHILLGIQSTKHLFRKTDTIPCCWTRLVVKLHAPIWLCNKRRKQPTDWVPIVMIVPPRWALIVLIVPPWTPPIDLVLHFCRTKIMVMLAEITNDIAAAWNRHCIIVNWGPDKISNERSSDQRLREKVGSADFSCCVSWIWGNLGNQLTLHLMPEKSWGKNQKTKLTILFVNIQMLIRLFWIVRDLS